MYVLDTNVYIRAFRNADDSEALVTFYARHLPRIALSAVVAHELAVGAQSPRKASELKNRIIAPFAARKRVLTPSFAAWMEAGEICGSVSRAGCYSEKMAQKGFFNDVLLAVSCREGGHVLLTWNLGDFEIVRKFVRFDYSAPWG